MAPSVIGYGVALCEPGAPAGRADHPAHPARQLCRGAGPPNQPRSPRQQTGQVKTLLNGGRYLVYSRRGVCDQMSFSSEFPLGTDVK